MSKPATQRCHGMKKKDKERKDGPYGIQVESYTGVVSQCTVRDHKWRGGKFSELSVCML